jgi:hypothetical protein
MGEDPMDFPNVDLEDLWQAVRLRYRRRRKGLVNRVQWALYSSFYRLVRRVLLAGARGQPAYSDGKTKPRSGEAAGGRNYMSTRKASHKKRAKRKAGNAAHPKRTHQPRAPKPPPARNAPVFTSIDPADAVKPQLNAGDQDLPRVTRAAEAALVAANNHRPRLFRFDGEAVRLELDPDGGVALRPLTVDRMRHELAEAADWFRRSKSGIETPAYPPLDVVRNLLAKADLALPILERVTTVPIFLPDGRLLTAPGYDEEYRIMLCPSPDVDGLEVPEDPSQGDVDEARRLLCDELLGEFPFAGPADLAHAICALLHPFVREMVSGATPLHLGDKTTPGEGSTLLVDVLCLPAVGIQLMRTTPPGDEGEWRRLIFSQLRSGSPVLFLDNVKGHLDSPTLAAAITSQRFGDRLIRTSEVGSAPVRCLWIATGTNPSLSAEINRRTLRIRLASGLERPELRSGFRHPHLKDWAAKNRRALVRAALTLVQAWICAGRPGCDHKLGMFEDYVQVFGGILAVVQISGFLENLHAQRQEVNTESTLLGAFVELWAEKFVEKRVGAADLLDLASALDLGPGDDQSRRVRLGKILHGLRDRRFGRWRIEHAGTCKGAQQYGLRGESDLGGRKC